MREDKLLGLDLREVFLPFYPESGPHPVDLVDCNVTPIMKTVVRRNDCLIMCYF